MFKYYGGKSGKRSSNEKSGEDQKCIKLTTNNYQTERAGLFNIFHDLPKTKIYWRRMISQFKIPIEKVAIVHEQLLPIEKGD